MRAIIVFLFIALPVVSIAQHLKPGFDKAEYMEMLKIAQRQATAVNKWEGIKTVPAPEHYKMAYRSPEVGLGNIWDLWIKKDGTALISVRGTTVDPVSWLANFYAAMVPAKGSLSLSGNFTFKYDLSDNPKAAVHVGWLISMAYLSRDMLPRIDSCVKAGINEFILTGHSQGAGITFLLTSYLEDLKATGRLPKSILFKTYCSAAPKPGNLYYAYSYEHLTRNGWGYSVVNTADWVPETPFSIQTLDDFNSTNAFKNAHVMIRKQKFPANMALKHVYNKLSKPAKKAQRNYEKYLGKMVSKMVIKQIPEFTAPNYYSSNNYTRAGSMIVLNANPAYFKIFPYDSDNIWMHHFIEPYMFLAEQLD